MSLTTKVKIAKFSFLNEKSYDKTVIDFNLSRQRIYPPLKVTSRLSGLGELSLFRVDKLCLPHLGQ